MVRQIRTWGIAGALALAVIRPASAQTVVPPGLGPITAYTGFLTWNRNWPAQIPSDWYVPQAWVNYQVPQVVYVPVAVPPSSPAVELVQVKMVTVRGDAPPVAVRVKQGTVVTWSNPGDKDRALVIDLEGLNGTSTASSRHSVTIPPKGNFSLAFHQPGVYRYYVQERPDQPASLVVEE